MSQLDSCSPVVLQMDLRPWAGALTLQPPVLIIVFFISTLNTSFKKKLG